jgi:hypothetical protein
MIETETFLRRTGKRRLKTASIFYLNSLAVETTTCFNQSHRATAGCFNQCI